jgi:signal transduction histidine kinase/CheY-like chemotaxis protein
LVLLNTHRRLFSDDDVALLGELGEQARVLAERGRLIGEKERLNAELAASVDALSMAGKAKSDFLAAMSHELRTPLNAIMGFADLMDAADPVGEDERLVPAEWVRHVRSGGTHLLELINDILDLAKVEAGRIDLKRETLRLPTVVGEVVTTLRVVSDRKQLHVTTDIPALTVVADRIRLRQILDNLLSNAIKFTPRHGRIHVSAQRTDTEVRVCVADTGIGISPEDCKKVFEEFTQVGDSDARQAGTGLGLALTRRLAEAHGGTIELQSEPDTGSQFTVCLPVHAAPVATDRSVPAPEPEPSPGGVLIIEDDPAAAQLLTAYLTDVGYPAAVATSGGQGLRQARQHRPAAILLDILLPDTDGWHVLRELKNDPITRDIPVIITTVLDEHEVGLALGAVDYLIKPIDPNALVALLSRHALLSEPPATATVLAIDDDPATLSLVTATLAGHGARTVTATTGRAGLELARGEPHDLVICALQLPDLDGFALTAALHADPATSGIPIVGLAANDLTVNGLIDADTGRLAHGVVDVVVKGEAARERLCQWLVRLDRARSGR